MAKVKLVRFQLAALIDDESRLIDYLQRKGIVELEDIKNKELKKNDTQQTILTLTRLGEKASQAVCAVEKYCSIKKSFLESFTDYTEIDYNDYRQLCARADEITRLCGEILELEREIEQKKGIVAQKQALIEQYTPWENLSVPMGTTRTMKTALFIGTFRSELDREQILTMLGSELVDVQSVDVQVISKEKMQTCALIICCIDDMPSVETALRHLGFARPENLSKKRPAQAIKEYREEIERLNEEIKQMTDSFSTYAEQYDNLRFLSDYLKIQCDKYDAMHLAAQSGKAFFLQGYMPQIDSEQLKFEIEQKFTAQVELYEPDYENEDVPVLLKNGSMAGGVENISNMYSPPSNKDIDPNPVMSVFYYALFGLMLSDGGYGLLMIIFALVAKFKVKVTGSQKKFADFVLYCGISTVFWGLMFGGWFSDLIPTLCTEFFGMENGPNLALWFEPTTDSIKLLLFSFLFGIVHLFAGLALRFYNLCRQHDFIGAVCDVVPVYLFVTGLAIVGKNFIEPVSDHAKSVGIKLLIAGAVLIILTAGRSAKNILGKLGGGLYALYNSTTGYLGDILSYSRLLALCLVTGVIGQVVNMLAALTGNIITFVIIFLIGHSINMAINLIGTYVHTCRLQYVEFFSKFYEGGGRVFTPFRINSKYFKLKEETVNG